MNNESPYPECPTCKTLADCKHAEKATDELGEDLPPDNCPQPVAVIRRTLHKRKLDRFKNQS